MLATLDDTALDGGPRKGAATERMCVVSRSVKPVEDLLRFVVGPDGSVLPDLKRNLPGRGLWVEATRKAVDQAVKRHVFAKGFKRDVKVDPELGQATDRLLERAALDSLAIAGKAGEVATGFTRAEAAIGHGGLLGLIHAADGAEDGRRKLEALLRRNAVDEQPEIPVIRAFSGMQLDLALGRPNVIHAALLAGPASQGFLTRCQRMLRFRTGETLRPGPDLVSGREPNVIESETESE